MGQRLLHLFGAAIRHAGLEGKGLWLYFRYSAHE
jgi:hypothetical protein